MTVTPGSLDYLYYNGILDHIPYEAYEMPPMGNMGTGRGIPMPGRNRAMYRGNGRIETNPQGMNNNPYMGMKGQNYGYYGNYGDSFGGMPGYGQMGGMQPQAQMYGGSYGGGIGGYNSGPYQSDRFSRYGQSYDYDDGHNFRESLRAETKGLKEGVLNSHPVAKGLLSTAVILAIPILLIKGLKKAPAASSSSKSFWEKINPKNWFKKKSAPAPSPSGTKTFWKKINPKNWWPGFWAKINPKNWGSKKP